MWDLEHETVIIVVPITAGYKAVIEVLRLENSPCVTLKGTLLTFILNRMQQGRPTMTHPSVC